MVKTLYNTKTWRDKVDKMSDEQVYAIYVRARRDAKL